ncbi:NADPH:quinone oxidoreductase family protein [Eisenibacter elegans]|jgi:NADPH2:quinone reductase|uniref:NADPH:quinone oxidoreductase family protein n=1 Tax=Eisenibacter elegans TaxID=997 RepID=UPI00042760E3|nr:NADPH:quinone oxidoreductase family protein [Eisenibacter elegans]
MKAFLCKQWGTPDDLVLEDISAPEPKPGEVRVAIKAVGINYPDVLMIAGKYQAKPPFPFIPCGEVAGVVEAVGEGVTHLKPGARVIALCETGGLAELVCTPAMMALPIPDSMSFEEAAAFTIVYGTAHVALKHRGNIKAKDTLLVHGAGGGVGLAAIDIARHLGATVIATASTAEKLAAAKEKGAAHLINYVETDFVEQTKAITQGRGVDLVFDPVGGDVFDKSLKVIAWEGRLLVIGFAGGRIPEVPTNLLLLKNAAAVGVFWGAYSKRNPQVLLGSLMELLQWYQQGHIKPHVSQALPLAQAPEALKVLANRQAIGKVVVTI